MKKILEKNSEHIKVLQFIEYVVQPFKMTRGI